MSKIQMCEDPFAVQELRELAGTFATMKRTGTDAVVVLAEAMFAAAKGQISALATETSATGDVRFARIC